MDPYSIASAVAGAATHTVKVTMALHSAYKRYKNAPLIISTAATKAELLRLFLQKLHDLVLARDDLVDKAGDTPDDLALFLDTTITKSMVILSCLDDQLQQVEALAYRSGAGKLSWTDKMGFVLEENKFKDIVGELSDMHGIFNGIMAIYQTSTLLEVRALVQQRKPDIDKVVEETQSLRQRYPRLSVARSIFSHDDDDAETRSTAAFSERSFAFDQQLINTRTYRQVFAQAQAARSQVVVPLGDLIDLSDPAERDDQDVQTGAGDATVESDIPPHILDDLSGLSFSSERMSKSRNSNREGNNSAEIRTLIRRKSSSGKPTLGRPYSAANLNVRNPQDWLHLQLLKKRDSEARVDLDDGLSMGTAVKDDVYDTPAEQVDVLDTKEVRSGIESIVQGERDGSALVNRESSVLKERSLDHLTPNTRSKDPPLSFDAQSNPEKQMQTLNDKTGKTSVRLGNIPREPSSFLSASYSCVKCPRGEQKLSSKDAYLREGKTYCLFHFASSGFVNTCSRCNLPMLFHHRITHLPCGPAYTDLVIEDRWTCANLPSWVTFPVEGRRSALSGLLSGNRQWYKKTSSGKEELVDKAGFETYYQSMMLLMDELISLRNRDFFPVRFDYFEKGAFGVDENPPRADLEEVWMDLCYILELIRLLPWSTDGKPISDGPRNLFTIIHRCQVLYSVFSNMARGNPTTKEQLRIVFDEYLASTVRFDVDRYFNSGQLSREVRVIQDIRSALDTAPTQPSSALLQPRHWPSMTVPPNPNCPRCFRPLLSPLGFFPRIDRYIYTPNSTEPAIHRSCLACENCGGGVDFYPYIYKYAVRGVNNVKCSGSKAKSPCSWAVKMDVISDRDMFLGLLVQEVVAFAHRNGLEHKLKELEVPVLDEKKV